ncbi:hypothetical protein BDV96DRAFT_558370 [Lophiotrema nucula]|uniref:Cora-like Mg2+ transporter protein-domain-containing protein n=1 Tax=Lophiotrema nucula TaxID=690887 RepID=A0A6A5YJD7_9PLEO|nr:hypothetical protein BDV96DRAFT_558370 [Lophiotrema nucula]
MHQCKHQTTLNSVREWTAASDHCSVVQQFLWRTLKFSYSLNLPSHADLLAMTQYYYPRRCDMKVYVCDFGPGRFQKMEVPLGESSMEDRFLKGNRDIADSLSSNASWPHTEIEALTLRDRDRMQDMLDVQKILRRGHPDLAEINNHLNRNALQDLSADLSHDVQWRAKHLGKSLSYWELVRSDFARFLLTMTAPGGVDYIDMNINEHLRLSSEAQAEDEQCSILGLLFEIFSETGSATWYQRSVDWFLVYILTEIAIKPNNYRMGCNAPSMMRTYQGIVQDLKAKRYDEFKRRASVALVREYLACIDEITTLIGILKINKALLQRLEDRLGDVLKGERTITPDNEHGESSMSRVQWASGIVDDNTLIAKELLADLHISLNALFQLRSIEQNELAIVADSQNQAVLVFTGVTIIFLPLSFFTSYFGMNLKGVVDTPKSELYFWKVCGTLGFVLFLLVALYAFRQRLKVRVESMMKGGIGGSLPL